MLKNIIEIKRKSINCKKTKNKEKKLFQRTMFYEKR